VALRATRAGGAAGQPARGLARGLTALGRPGAARSVRLLHGIAANAPCRADGGSLRGSY